MKPPVSEALSCVLILWDLCVLICNMEMEMIVVETPKSHSKRFVN